MNFFYFANQIYANDIHKYTNKIKHQGHCTALLHQLANS